MSFAARFGDGALLRAPSERVRVSSPGDVLEVEADRMASAALAASRAQRNADTLPALPAQHDQPLPPPLRREMEAGFGGADFGSVRLHRDADAARSAAALHASAYTSGSQIVLGAPPTRPLIAHELAHMVQRSRGAVPAGLIQRQPTALSGIPEAERKAIKMGTIPVSVPAERIAEFFKIMPSGRPSESRSVGATDSFDPAIAANLRQGLSSIAAYVAGDTNALPLNSSVEVELDLSAHGGARTTYRFTRFSHASGSGRTASTAHVMLIEQVGAALARPAMVSAPTGAFTVGTTNYTLAGTWSDGDYTVLREALGLLPAAAMTAAAGLTFRRVGGGTGPEAGHYNSGTDAVELNNLAFPTTATDLRIGQRPPSVHKVLHEVGHAIDLRVLERAWQAYNAAGQTAAARRTLLAVRSPSGSRWGRAAGSTNDEIQENAADATPAFRAAVARDGVRRDTSGSRTTPEGTTATLSGGITTYSETDYQELYAESFAMYVAARETMRQLRPATFAYFQGLYP